jgi:hypothetical protein
MAYLRDARKKLGNESGAKKCRAKETDDTQTDAENDYRVNDKGEWSPTIRLGHGKRGRQDWDDPDSDRYSIKDDELLLKHVPDGCVTDAPWPIASTPLSRLQDAVAAKRGRDPELWQYFQKALAIADRPNSEVSNHEIHRELGWLRQRGERAMDRLRYLAQRVLAECRSNTQASKHGGFGYFGRASLGVVFRDRIPSGTEGSYMHAMNADLEFRGATERS